MTAYCLHYLNFENRILFIVVIYDTSKLSE